MSSPNHSTSDLEDAFSSMNILNYTSVSSDYFSASSESSSFNSSENSKDNMIPPVFSSFYNNPCLKDVQAFYAKELPISHNPINSPAILTPSPIEDKGNIINNSYNNNNNDHHQQQNRKQETFRTYTATNGYTGNRPLCERCTLHHIGPCTVKCRTCNKIGHLTKNYRRLATGNNQQTVSVTCNACGKKGHYASQCSKVNNRATGKHTQR
ncbi:reverse transcriptase domain-containing protein [Tanacetum coccineum]